MTLATDPDDLIALIYDAAVDRTLWSSVLEKIADHLHCSGSALIMQDRASGLGEGVFIRSDPANLADYFGHFSTVNPLIAASEHLRTGDVVTDRDVISRDRFTKSEYFQDFMLPNDMSSMLAVTVLRDGDSHCAFNFCRRPSQEEHDVEELAFGRRLMPHLQRAFAISLKLADAEANLGASAMIIDHLACGVVVFDTSGAVLHVNTAAERIADAADGFSFGVRGVAGTELRSAVLRAARGGDGASMLLQRPSGRPALSALVTPLRQGPVWLPHRPAAMLVLGDPDVSTVETEDRLRALYKLTGAEAAVSAHLMSGANPQDIAQRLGIGMATVRQHVGRAFAKTGTTRQAELVQLLLRTVGAIQ